MSGQGKAFERAWEPARWCNTWRRFTRMLGFLATCAAMRDGPTANETHRSESLEIEQDTLMREIKLPLTIEDRRQAAFTRRDELMTQWAELVEELKIHEGKIQ